ncbi:OmpP1/FadL family transporter [Neisseria lisongii]|uniref:OmpP1/FadL family transporter n=1 Tax=Neisseria lisongii TaxID=2912188 RepID=A0AAW5AQJ5_9NEIS|nr:OmpP1/FadL family transporter [Neisseria lisongii]MCF7530540.1 OmpP1/FadL family transporter [Neisseria lisongii]
MLKKITVLVSGLFVAHLAHASGYHFGTQSVTAQSTANSSAAEAADATTIFSNPAGLAKLDSDQITASLNLVAPHIRYSDAKATYRDNSFRTNAPITTDSKGNAAETSGKITKDVVAAPHIYGAHKINDDVTVGLGVYVPFASSTEYSKNSVLRHHLNQLGLTTVAVEPVVSFKINPQHAVGVGAIAQYSSAELRKYADWDATGSVSVVAGRDVTGKADGHAKVKGNDWGFGYQLGWLWDINDQTRVGVNYRSKVEHNLKGTADWYADGPAVATANPNPLLGGKSLYDAVIGQPTTINKGTPLEGRGYVPHEKASVKIVTPESLSVHGMYKATDKLNLFGDVTWTRHSRFNRAELVFENEKNIGSGKKSDRTIITPNWRNTYKVAFGGSYQYSEPLQLRAGIAFDQSPVRGASSRLNTLPDGNRIWYSIGAKYQPAKNHVFDVAYSHIHINDTTFSAAASTGDNVDSKGTGSAKFNNYANIVGLQYTYKF